MPADLFRLNMNKDRILSFIKTNGPSLPVQIARYVGISTIFASAFLSELKSEGKINVSDMKVGSSPLYYLPGQGQQLEKFIDYLNQREKEAFLLLKKEKILEDGKQEPVVRVALHALKDFAADIKVKVDEDSKIFWKYFALSDDEFMELVKERLGLKKEVPAAQVASESSKEERKKETKEAKKKIIKKKKKIDRAQTFLIEERKEDNENNEKKEIEKPVLGEKKQKVQETEFGNNLRDYLIAKDIEIREAISEKKKDFEAVIRIDSLFGKQEFYLVAKDKKSISDSDLLLALQKAQSRKMPALVMANGELSKKAKEYIKDWGNLIKFEQVKF